MVGYSAPVTVGLSVYDMAAADVLELSVAAEQAGFDAIWLGEHIVLPVGYATAHPTTRSEAHQHIPGPIVKPDTELVDPWVALASVAATTTRLRLATGIYLLSLRHPLVTARSACTLQVASHGRLLLGVGAGWLAEEFAALDVPFDERFGRLVESIEILRAASAGGPFDYHGKYFSFDAVQISAEAIHVPIIMGGNTPTALERAARLGDGWFSSGTPNFDEARRLRDTIVELRGRSGLDAPFRCYVRIATADPLLVERYRAEGIDDVVVWADQLWPADGDLDAKRTALSTTALALGLEPRA
jgi:probable F420-dependent oxidoreductase